MYYVYIVRCADDSLYTGIAAQLSRRLKQHADKAPTAAKYTRSRPIVGLECAWRCPGRSEASRLESGIKHLLRAQKLALIADPAALAQLLPQLDAGLYTHLPGLTLEACLKGEMTL